VIIGTLLFTGFVFYTQYEKNAEPAWKVNTKKFHVLESWEELMEMEKMKFHELKFVDHFRLLKDSNISIPLSNEQRSLKIEKTWNYGYQLYVLYSVDLKERDKDEGDIPRLEVHRIKLTSEQNKEFEGTAELFPDETAAEGYVYKHRLYRSLMIHPDFNRVYTQEDWEELTKSTRFELSDISLNSKKGVSKLKPIAFQVEPPEMFGIPKAIASTPVNQTIKIHTGENIRLKDLEFFKIGSRVMLDKEIDKNVVSLIGEVKIGERKHPVEYEIGGMKDSGYYLQTYSIMDELLNMDKSDEGSFTITHSVHRTNKSYSFSVTKADLEQFSAKQTADLSRNEAVMEENGVKVVYEGLAWDDANNTGGIKFSMEINHQQDNIEDFFLYPRPSYHFVHGAEEIDM
jgi:hypothetical protein